MKFQAPFFVGLHGGLEVEGGERDLERAIVAAHVVERLAHNGVVADFHAVPIFENQDGRRLGRNWRSLRLSWRRGSWRRRCRLSGARSSGLTIGCRSFISRPI